MRAAEAWRDDVTGVSVRPGSRGASSSGDLVARVRVRKGAPVKTVAVEPEEVVPASKSYRVDPSRESAIKARAGTAKRAKTKREPATFRSAKEAADLFYDRNPFFAEAAEADPIDSVSDWASGYEIRTGKRWQPLAKTARGRALLELYRRTPEAGIRETLRFLFGRAKGRRWRALDWPAIDSFVAALHASWRRESRSVSARGWTSGGVLSWYPPGASQTMTAAELATLPPEAERKAADRINADRLADDLAELERVMKQARRCLSAEDRQLWQRRVRQLRALRDDPDAIARLSLCEPEGSTRVCRYPVLWEQTGRLRRACTTRTTPSDDLDLPWENPRKTLPPKAARQWEHVYQSALDAGYPKDRAAQQAWGAVKAGYVRRGGRWRRRNPQEPSSRPLQRSPVGNLDGQELAELGMVLEVEAGGVVFRWQRGVAPLLWSPRARALVWIQGARKGKRVHAETHGRVAKTFERWADRSPRWERHQTISIVDKWRSFGPAKRVDYWSDKWGRQREYTHDHGSGVTLYRGGGPRPPWVWVLRGGRLNVTPRGIVG